MNKKEAAAAIEARLPENPLIKDLVIHANSKLSFKEFTEADKDGFRSPKTMLFEAAHYVKVFLDSDARIVVDRLSPSAKSLFIYILFRLKERKDYIKIDAKEYAVATGVMSRTTFTNAKNELYRLRFIEPTAVRSIYFINPGYFFYGSRPFKYPTKTIIRYTESQL